MVIGFLCAFVGTIAFSHLFNVPKKHYFLCGLVGAVGYLCYYLLDMRVSAAFSTFIATLVVVLFSRILTVIRKCPITIFLISGIFPPQSSFHAVLLSKGSGRMWGKCFFLKSKAAVSKNNIFHRSFTIAAGAVSVYIAAGINREF